eukprot:snap_masked-scaffold_44-processed-gene-1.50-mRNA-1 protein AED:1.00 eAED:1.00 QI:0/-1/0/0/-1/1/1/0/87
MRRIFNFFEKKKVRNYETYKLSNLDLVDYFHWKSDDHKLEITQGTSLRGSHYIGHFGFFQIVTEQHSITEVIINMDIPNIEKIIFRV